MNSDTSELKLVDPIAGTKNTASTMASAFCDDALGKDDAVAVAQRIASGEISAKEAVEAAITRAHQVNPKLNAIVIDRYDLAHQEASLESSGSSGGALAGVPTFVKDNNDVKGLPSRYGSRAVGAKNATESSPFIKQQLDSLGLITLGKSTLPEFGLTTHTASSLMGATTNPWNINHSAGGSSGGSAALVASGVVPIAHANDGGGSIRVPAACCGLVGLKPSRGRLLDLPGVDQLPINIITEGVVSRSVRDTAAFYHNAEQCWRNPLLPEIGNVLHPNKKRLKMAVCINRVDGVPAEFDCARVALESAALCEELGHDVETVSLPFSQTIQHEFLHYWSLLAFAQRQSGKKAFGSNFDKDKLEGWTKTLSKRFIKNIWRTPITLRRLRKFQHHYEDAFKQYDVLITPTGSTAAPKLAHLDPSLPSETIMARLLDYAAFTPFQNASGGPAISLPMGSNRDGLPVGIQFASTVGTDRQLLELAFELEEAKPWRTLANF